MASWYLILFFSILLIVVLIILISYNIYLLFRKKRANKKILNLLNEIMQENKINYNILEAKNGMYDFFIETAFHNYYIKIVYNFNYADICLNSKYKWAKGYTHNQENQKYFSNIYQLVDFVPENSKKENVKIYLIYKGCRTIMRYINECEMSFVYPTDLIDDFRIITYNQLESDHSIIEGR